jgi:hypothetical protein
MKCVAHSCCHKIEKFGDKSILALMGGACNTNWEEEERV